MVWEVEMAEFSIRGDSSAINAPLAALSKASVEYPELVQAFLTGIGWPAVSGLIQTRVALDGSNAAVLHMEPDWRVTSFISNLPKK